MVQRQLNRGDTEHSCPIGSRPLHLGWHFALVAESPHNPNLEQLRAQR